MMTCLIVSPSPSSPSRSKKKKHNLFCSESSWTGKMFFRSKVTWSLLETDYLKEHRNDDRNQLCLYMSKSRNAVNKKLLEIDGKLVPKVHSKKRSNIGKREDLGIFVRSGWEANVCRYLKSLNISYEYEPQVFTFAGVKHGTVSYCPDLKLADGTWIEIKGFCDGKSKTQIRRFKKHFPVEFARLKVVTGSPNTKATLFFREMGVPVYAFYNELNKQHKKTIPFWE